METKSKALSLKKKRKIFGWLFLVSFLVFFSSNMLFTRGPMISEQDIEQEHPPTNDGPIAQPPPPPAGAASASTPSTAVIVSVVSLLTSITSLVGFVSTTVLAWRKEKRETLASELEIKKKELELEKLRVELEKSKKTKKNGSA